VTIVMALLLSKGGLQLTTPEAGGARRAIAIVGFKNSSGRTDVAWLSTAFAEAIGSELAAAKGVRVIPAETVARMKAELRLSEADGFSRDTLTRVRAGVGADLVLTGAYIATGSGDESQVRLDLRVQEVQSGYTVARASQNGTTGRLFDLLNQTTRAILDELGLEGPTETDGTALRASIPETPDATRLYAEGLEKLRVGDALGARDVLLRATVAEPSFALAHAALARAWILLGFDSSAADAAKRAMDLSGSLGETDRLWIEGLYRGTTKQWDRAIATYRTLFDRFPDSVDYGLRLAETQTIAGKAKDALETVAALRKLPGPGRDDPQIDLAEAAAAQALSDFARELTAASEAARKATDAGASILVARARMAEGWAFRNLGDLDKAKAANQDAKRLYSAAGDRRGVARAMIQVGSVLRAQGNLRGAEMELVQALQIVREIGNSRNTAQTLVNLANVLFDTGRAAEAQPLYTEAAALYRTIGDQTGLASALSNLAEVLNRQGEFAAGLKVATEALAIRRKVGSKSGIALSLLNMAEVLSDQGELGRSRAMYQESLALNRETGSQEEISYSLHGLGRVLLRQDKLSDAKAKQDEARRIRETLGAKVAIAESRAAIAELLCEDQRFGEASDLALSAADVARDEKDIDLEARSRGIAASAFLSADRIPEARQSLDRVATLARTSWSRRTRMELDIVTARLQAASGQVDAALNLLKAVKADATKIGFVAYVLEAQLARAVILSRTSQLELARSELNQVERDATARGFQLISRKAARTNRVSAK
jgi:tetratricopeptide (TPR) repeat protein